MNLYRIQIVPRSPWLTPWQSDTLAGLLCWVCARALGPDLLTREILDPSAAGEPPFVLSDAFPGDLLPVPLAVRLRAWPAELRKVVKRASWISCPAFHALQRGKLADAPLANLLLSDAGLHTYSQLRNAISRSSNTTSLGGGLFNREETVLGPGTEFLTVYARVRDGALPLLDQLFNELAHSGFGADVSAGKGEFDIGSPPQLAPDLDDVPNANAVASLSTFQPAPHDPTAGCWQTLTKYGKLGPDFGLQNNNVFKRPLILLRPGACFAPAPPRSFVGRAIPMHDLLAPAVVEELTTRNIHVWHFAFGLAVPLHLPEGAPLP